MEMGLNTLSEAEKSKVLERLKSLSNTDRMLLLNKYSHQTENIYCTFGTERNIDIITKIFMLKFNKDALIDAYVKGDPVIDEPGSRLNDFLDNEFQK
jgi:hypothetical protein